MIDILHVCPAGCATGGPEAIHAFVSELNKADGVRARIWYWDVNSSHPMPEEYEKYGCEYVLDMEPDFDGVIIVPEIWANMVMEFTQCTRMVYWLGIDAYAGWTQESHRGDFLKDDRIIHIAQSQYAVDFLRSIGVKHIIKCVDVVNMDFYADYEEPVRNNVVLYNPAKATPFMYKVMETCNDISWQPIAGMTRAQVIDAMRHCKLYVDFGEFPGRERIPREAVLSGCCLITSKIGSAGYEEDFMHWYKFESKESHLWAIKRKIHDVLDNYEECRHDFDLFRLSLRNDIERMKEQCRGVIHEVQYNHTGAQR